MLLLFGILSVAVQGISKGPSMSLFSSSTTDVDIAQSTKLSPLMRSILNIRGGDEDEDADEEEEEDDEEEEEEEAVEGIDYAAIMQKALDVTKEVVEVTKVKIYPVVKEYSQIGAVKAKDTSISLYKAIRRAISAAMEGDDDEDSDDEDSDDEDGETALDKAIAISKKTIACVKRMIKAAMTVPETEASAEDEDDDEEEVADEETEEAAEEETKDTAESTAEDAPEEVDFGSYLAEAYGVADERNSGKGKGVTILGGSLQDALQTAKLEARMLLVMIPAEKPEGERGGWFGSKKGNAESEELDKIAIESLLSQEVSKAANKKSLKKKGDGESGSFAIWLGKSGSSEATSAIKQLKLKETSTKGTKRPIMCVVYPTVSAVSATLQFPIGRNLRSNIFKNLIFFACFFDMIRARLLGKFWHNTTAIHQ